jgi:hypothetical protein
MRADSRQFIKQHHTDLHGYKCLTSRAYMRDEKRRYMDDWWFAFFDHELDEHEYFVFAGAKDGLNRDFQVFKVPTAFLKENLHKLDRTAKGWVNIYLHVQRFEDVRNDARLSFRQFAV